MAKKKKEEDFNPVLETAKSETMKWSRNPTTEMEKRTFSRIHTDAPYVLAVFNSEMDRIEQLLKAKIDEKDFTKFTVDKKIRSEFAHNFSNVLLEASVAVRGARARLLIDMLKNMNRPANNFMAGLAGMLGGHEQELDETEIEEVPVLE